MTSSRTSEPIEPNRAEAPAADGRVAALDRLVAVQLGVVALVIAVAVLWLFSDVLLVLFAATLIACQLGGAARFLKRHVGLPYGVALAIVVLTIAACIGAAFVWRGPRIVSELQQVWQQINQQIFQLWHRFGGSDWLQKVVERVQAYLSARGGNIAGVAAGFVTSTLGNVGTLLLIVVAAIYLATSPEKYRDGLVALLPHGWRRRGAAVLAQESHTLRRWFVGQLVDMVAIGIMTSIGLWALGVPLFPTLGLIAALFNFVPYIGALAGSVPAIVVALGQSPQTALWVALLFFAVQSLEGNLISPLISRRTVDLPPVLTLLSQTVLGTLFGPFGLILATPITAAALVLVKMIYVETILGDAPDQAQADPRKFLMTPIDCAPSFFPLRWPHIRRTQKNKGVHMLRLTLATVSLVAFAAVAQAAPQLQRVRGTVESATDTSVTVKTDDGKSQEVALSPDTKFVTVGKSSLDEVKDGKFIGTATKGENPPVALEVVIFPESMKGTAEGHYDWDSITDTAAGGKMTKSKMTNGTIKSSMKPMTKSKMTNGTIKSGMSSGGNKTIDVTYDNGQSLKIEVPSTAPIVEFTPADKSILKPGAKLFSVTAVDGSKLDGKLVAIGTDGVTPPM